MGNGKDVRLLRDLAKQYMEIASEDVQDERRELWRRHNSLERTRPLVYARWFACSNEVVGPQLECEDGFYRVHETFLRRHIFQASLEDDYVIEPWIKLTATHVTPPSPFGPKYGRIPSPEPGGAWKFDPPLKDLGDIEKLAEVHHVIDEAATRRRLDRLQDAVGDILPVCLSRAPLYSGSHADISTDLGYLRDVGQVMWDMVTEPEWLHRVVGTMSQGISALRTRRRPRATGASVTT